MTQTQNCNSTILLESLRASWHKKAHEIIDEGREDSKGFLEDVQNKFKSRGHRVMAIRES